MNKKIDMDKLIVFIRRTPKSNGTIKSGGHVKSEYLRQMAPALSPKSDRYVLNVRAKAQWVIDVQRVDTL